MHIATLPRQDAHATPFLRGAMGASAGLRPGLDGAIERSTPVSLA
jgi:hypothetical protein